MNISLSKKTRKLLVVVLVSLIIIVYPTTFLQHAKAADSGYVIIYSPTAYERYPYWESVNIHYRVIVRSGWLLESSRIFIDGQYKGMYSQSFVNVNIHGLASKIHTLKIEVNCFRARPFDYDQYNTFRTFYTYSATEQDDIDDMRIDKLHDIGKAGQGVTICLMIDGLGYNDIINSNYHPSIYKEYSNVLRDVEYFVFDEDSRRVDPTFRKLTSDWDQLTPAEKWDEIRDLNAGRINETHGTGALSSLVQIAPHAKFILVDHDGDNFVALAALKWMTEEDIHITYDIEVLNLYWAEKKSSITDWLEFGFFWGDTTYTWNDFENWFDEIANSGGTNRKVITVAPAASSMTTYQNTNDARFPAALPTVIGVTGVFDDGWDENSWKFKISFGEGFIPNVEKDNNGYGIDIAALDNYTALPWTIHETPLGSYNKFDGTCNAAVFVSGITAILKQVYDPLTVSQLKTALRYTGDPEGYSPKEYENGDDEGGAHESLNPYVENIFGYYPGNYRVAWGIIDIYETYLYITDNFIP